MKSCKGNEICRESLFNINEHVPYRDKCWKTLGEKSVLWLHMHLCSGGSKRKMKKDARQHPILMLH